MVASMTEGGRAFECKCLSCGEVLDVVSDLSLEVNQVRPGDITVCLYCGHVGAFAEDLSLRELTPEEVHEVAGNEEILALQKARTRVHD